MNKMNFPPFIINAFKALHAHTTAQVMINGKLSNEFNVYSGVRQGCPWAPLLFIILMEPFAEAIRSNTDIHGIDIPKYSIPPQTNTDSVSVKFSGYADDSTIFTSDISSMLRLNNIFHLFHQASGEKLNLNKCIILLIGDFPNNHIQHLKDYYPNTPIKTQHHCTIYLGSPIGNDSDPSFWNSILTKFQNKISSLKLLNLSTFGRARTAQSYALSCIWYTLGHSNLPSSHDYICKITSLYRNFVLNNHDSIPDKFGSECYRISLNSAQLHPKYGGLGLLMIPKYLDVIRFMHLVKIIRRPNSSTFHILAHLCNVLTHPWNLGLYGLLCNNPIIQKQINHSTLIKSLHALISYFPINKLSQPLIPPLILAEPLFFNPNFNSENSGYSVNSWKILHTLASLWSNMFGTPTRNPLLPPQIGYVTFPTRNSEKTNVCYLSLLSVITPS